MTKAKGAIGISVVEFPSEREPWIQITDILQESEARQHFEGARRLGGNKEYLEHRGYERFPRATRKTEYTDAVCALTQLLGWSDQDSLGKALQDIVQVGFKLGREYERNRKKSGT